MASPQGFPAPGVIVSAPVPAPGPAPGPTLPTCLDVHTIGLSGLLTYVDATPPHTGYHQQHKHRHTGNSDSWPQIIKSENIH